MSDFEIFVVCICSFFSGFILRELRENEKEEER